MDTTLEVLNTFDLDLALICFDKACSIIFQLFREQQRMSFIKFALLLRLYDTDFPSTPQYEQLLIDFPPGITAKGVWQQLKRRRSYEPDLTNASFLIGSTHRYMYTVIVHLFTGRVNSTGVVD